MKNKSLAAVGQISAVVLILLVISLSAVQSVSYQSVEERRQRLWNQFLDVFGDDIEKLYFYGRFPQVHT